MLFTTSFRVSSPSDPIGADWIQTVFSYKFLITMNTSKSHKEWDITWKIPKAVRETAEYESWIKRKP